jgi:Amt family ammonium transporter
VAGAICYWGCIKLKQKLGYDDSLDVFGVHGIGGATGTILCGVFAVAAVGDTAGLLEGNPRQLLWQIYGVVATLVWSGVITFVLLKIINLFAPLRVREEEERTGLDLALHGEQLQ